MSRCQSCLGSKKIIGAGMLTIDCPQCTKKQITEVSIDKRSKSYKEAILKLKSLYPSKTKKEIEKIFSSEYDKI